MNTNQIENEKRQGSIVLYTPGHHLITDSLIMHGIVRYLMWAGVNIDSVKIRRLGDRFPRGPRGSRREGFIYPFVVYPMVCRVRRNL